MNFSFEDKYLSGIESKAKWKKEKKERHEKRKEAWEKDYDPCMRIMITISGWVLLYRWYVLTF